MELMVEASPRRIFANAHTYHINSISINSDCETYLSADDLRFVMFIFWIHLTFALVAEFQKYIFFFDLSPQNLFRNEII